MLHPTFLESAVLSNNYLSSRWPMANRTAPWHPVSSTVNNWILPHTQDVVYEFNEFGYRDIDWNDHLINNSIWCLGDSQTVGMGTHRDKIWSSRLQELMNIPTINAGIAGASNDTISRILISGASLYNPKAVCCLLTAPNRREIINNSESYTLFPNSLKNFKTVSFNLFEQYLNSVDTMSDSINRDKNILLIKYFCESKNIPLLIIDFSLHVPTLCKTDLAFDNLHIGYSLHNSIAEYFKNNLKLHN
jgi:hypothetical protein